MKFLKILGLFIVFCLVLSVFAGSINYGYNAHGDYKPTSIGGNIIQYGYNAHGNYVPQRINSY